MNRRDFIKMSTLGTASLALPATAMPWEPPEITLMGFLEKQSVSLFPVQRVVLKAIYGIPLDDIDQFPVKTSPWHNYSHSFTEAGYLEWLYTQGRSNIYEVTPGDEKQEMVLCLGRRGGKRYMMSQVLGFELTRLLGRYTPQDRYGISRRNQISLPILSLSRDAAVQDLNALREVLGSSLDHCKARDSDYCLGFQSARDIADTGKWWSDKAQVSVQVKSLFPRSKGVKGSGNLVVVMHDCAHYPQDIHNLESLQVALTPSVVSFSPKDEKGHPQSHSEGKVFMVSSPRTYQSPEERKQDFFYKRFHTGFDGTEFSERMLCLQIPTWELYPLFLAEDYKSFQETFRADEFYSEFGAQFITRRMSPR